MNFEWLTKDWGLKLISLVLAIGLWSYAVGEESIEVTRTVPLQIQVENPSMSVLKKSVNTLQVTLSAQRSLLSDLTSEDIQAVHKIGAEVKNAGEYSFRIEPSEIRLSKPQIRIIRIEPSAVTMTLDEVIVKKLQVKPQLAGDPAFGYKVAQEEIQLDPNAVMVEGPKAELEKIDSVMTEPVDLVGRIRSFRRTLSIQLPDNIKTVSETFIDTYIPIKEEFEEKTFDQIPLKVLQPSDREVFVEAKPQQVTFTLSGSKRQLEKLDPATILIYVDTSGLAEGEHQATIQTVLPEDVAFKDKVPSVTVSISRKRR